MMQPDRHQRESVGDTLKRRLRQLGLSGPIQAAWVCQEINKRAEGRYEAVSYRGGTITLKAPNTILAHELRHQNDELVKNIINWLGWSAEKKIRVRIVV